MAGCGPCKNQSRAGVGYLRNAHAKAKRMPKHKRPKKGHRTTIPLNRPNTNYKRETGLYLPQIEVRPGVRS